MGSEDVGALMRDEHDALLEETEHLATVLEWLCEEGRLNTAAALKSIAPALSRLVALLHPVTALDRYRRRYAFCRSRGAKRRHVPKHPRGIRP